MSMKLKANRASKYYQITFYESAIDAHWNSFPSKEAAVKYLETELVMKNKTDYGICQTTHKLWKYEA